MKGCELCDRAARMFCESDQASLCWECDAKVHGANFLVARHPRSLLCRRCQAATPWRAAGPKLIPTFTVCECCASVGKEGTPGEGEERQGEGERGGGDGDRMMEDDDDDVENDGDDEDEDSDADEEEEGENQVVPWTLTPPPAASSSGSEESSSPRTTGSGFLKGMSENADLVYRMDLPCSSSNRSHLATTPAFPGRSGVSEIAASASTSFRPSKNRWRSILCHAPLPAVASPVSTVGGSHFYARRNQSSVDPVYLAYRSPPI